MSYLFYQQTMEQLSQSLKQKLKVPVEYVQNVYPSEVIDRWLKKDNEIIFPLSLNLKKTGHIKIGSCLTEIELHETHSIIQWTLSSLAKLFQEHNTSLYADSQNVYPLMVQEGEDHHLVLRKVFDLYEQSNAKSFVHCSAIDFQKELFSSDLDQTFIFISKLLEASKEDQLFLSHFLRTSQQTPLIAVSVFSSLNHIRKNKLILPSLLEHFVSFWSEEGQEKKGMV